MLIQIAVALVLLIMIILAALDVFWPFTAAIVLIAIGIWWKEGIHIFKILWQPEFIGIYISIGFIWVFFKWTREVERCLRQGDRRPPRWAEHNYDYAAYFFYWPIDMVAYFLSDFIREAWRFLSSIVERSFDRYAEWRFAKKSHWDKERID